MSYNQVHSNPPPVYYKGQTAPTPSQMHPLPMPQKMMTAQPLASQAHVTACSEPTLATCSRCGTTGMTCAKKTFTGCQIASGVILCFTALAPIGILLFLLGNDVEHSCSRCGNKLGTKKGWR